MQCIPAIMIKKLTITVHPTFIIACNFGPDVLIQLPEPEVWLHALGFRVSPESSWAKGGQETWLDRQCHK
jgi:hypothetical protein